MYFKDNFLLNIFELGLLLGIIRIYNMYYFRHLIDFSKETHIWRWWGGMELPSTPPSS